MTTFLLPTLTPRPAVLVIPGGGYTSVCEKTEGPPAALAFNRLGFHAFVLNYRVAPNRFPAPLEDAVRAVKIIRAHAEEWKIIPDRIVSCGFSAGGHLAGSLGILQKPQPGLAAVRTGRAESIFSPHIRLSGFFREARSGTPAGRLRSMRGRNGRSTACW